MASMWWAQDNAPETARTNSELEDLFVFGYACKVFRDDEKASYIDQGKHLIPWMGDDRLMIDRYDGRGHLYDLSAYDAENVKKENIELSETETAVETACDEERYLELRTDIAEAELYQEEEWKRYYESLHDGYKAVGFSYDQPVEDTLEQQQGLKEIEDDKPFAPPPELQVPKGVTLPASKKANAIIEKTAKFVEEHGAQMEIIIKTKQSGNPQFDFMHFENELSQYYKHMVKMIKSGKYKPQTQEQEDEGHEDEDDDNGYLHPLLNPTSATQPSKPIKMPAVSINDTPYGQLIKSIKRNSAKVAENSSSLGDRDTPPLAPPPMPPFANQTVYPSAAHTGLPPPPGTEPVVLPSSELPHIQGLHPRRAMKQEDEGGGSAAVSQIVPPPPDIQPIIDRMAMYVAKNGVEFEIVVKSKDDTRFQFLHPWHVHFPYYDFKKKLFLKEVEQERLEKEEAAAAAANKAVSFSIKTRTKEPENVTQLKKPLFDECSLVVKAFAYDAKDVSLMPHIGESDSQKERTTDITSSSPPVSDSGQVSEVILEVKQEVRSDIPLEVLEKKMAEERLKDRLANAAREKLAQASKEKQVQAERKRKAAMFINLLKIKPTSADESSRDGAQESCKRKALQNMTGMTATGGAGPGGQGQGHLIQCTDHVQGHLGGRHRSRSRSPVYQWRRRRSPTPPSAFSVIRRSPVRRPSPRLGSGRRKSRSRSPRRVIPLVRPGRRSRSPKKSKSPTKKRSRSRDRKRKSRSPSRNKKRSRSKSPSSKHKKNKKSDARSPKKKKKDKDKEKSKDKRKDKSRDKVKDKEKHRNKDKSGKHSTEAESSSKTETKNVEESKGSESEHELEKSDGRDSSSDSEDEVPPAVPRPQEIDAGIEIIEIDDNDDPIDDIPQPPGPPPSLPPLPLDDERTQSPRLPSESDLTETTSGRDSPAVDPSKPPREVSKHLLSRVRALLKASRDEILKEGDGVNDDP
ncbi:splicing factor, suppressor of white-apricot homolog [Haliotis rubra]|uniref:splicing factor, suppressor of white-apricot homolog n=1 Tax=Haliotis rubra TaxID=36100 RepID=UPI001EE5DE1A|nr:splicing factor, suppressor of white-apricot homolog [Haliotis rubra]